MSVTGAYFVATWDNVEGDAVYKVVSPSCITSRGAYRWWKKHRDIYEWDDIVILQVLRKDRLTITKKKEQKKEESLKESQEKLENEKKEENE